MNKRLSFKYIFLGIVVFAFMGGAIGYSCSSVRVPIYEFEYERDMPAVRKIFDQDLYWLSADESYKPDFSFKYHTPHESPLYFGQMKIKVLRLNNELVGFTTYYMESKESARLLFIAVRPEFRGKRYGQQLIEYALKDLAQMGAKKVKLTTRPSNLSGQKLYKRVGFVETGRDDTFVYFLYTMK